MDESKKDRIRIETRSASVPGGALVHVMSERRDSRNHNLLVNESVAFVSEVGEATPTPVKTDAPKSPEVPAKAPIKKAGKKSSTKVESPDA